MIKISIIEGLPFITSTIKHHSKELKLGRMLVDTGSAGTVISSDKLIEIGIQYEPEDMIHRIRGVGGSEFVFTKTIDTISIGHLLVNSFEIEVGCLDYGFEMDGIFGIDFLSSFSAIIDLSNFSIYTNRN